MNNLLPKFISKNYTSLEATGSQNTDILKSAHKIAHNQIDLNPSKNAPKAPSGGRLGSVRGMGDGFGDIPIKIREKPDPKILENRKEKERKERRRHRYADQRKAAQIWRHYNPQFGGGAAGKGVTACAWTLRQEGIARVVRVDVAGKKPRAHFKGLHLCDLRWVCPCCTIKKSEENRGELNSALAQARRTGLRPVMLTLTARHRRNQKLADFWGKLSTAEQLLKKSRIWRAINAKYLKGGFAKAVEVTHGDNGWHPHLHIIFMTDAKTESDAELAPLSTGHSGKAMEAWGYP